MFKAQRRGAETFGDFCARVGFDALRAYQASYIAPAAVAALPKVGSGGRAADSRACCLGRRGLPGCAPLCLPLPLYRR